MADETSGNGSQKPTEEHSVRTSCPNCGKGKVFAWKGKEKTHRFKCQHCGHEFEVEDNK